MILTGTWVATPLFPRVKSQTNEFNWMVNNSTGMSKVSDLSTRDLQWTTLNKPFQGPANYHYEEQLRRKRQNNNNNNKKKKHFLLLFAFCASVPS